eukprot:XP_013987025.1 PREDICTED: nephrocystin-3-like [Salmo salar]
MRVCEDNLVRSHPQVGEMLKNLAVLSYVEESSRAQQSMEIKEAEQSLVCGRPRVDTRPVGTCLACEGPHLSHMPPEMHWWRRSEGGNLHILLECIFRRWKG